MDDFENVSRLVSQTGSGFEEARYAYEACGKDMLAAAVMLERAKNKNNSGAKTSESRGSCESFGNYSRVNDDFTQWEKNFDQFDNELKKGAQRAAKSAGGFFSKLARNNVTVSGSREYFSMPIIAAVVLLLFLWSGIIPAIVISLLFGISYTFSGPDFSNEYVFGFGRPQKKSQSGNADESRTADNTYAQGYDSYENQDKGFFNDR